MSQFETKVKEVLIDTLKVEEHETTPEARIKEELSADSLDEIELIMELEKECHIQITDEEAECERVIQLYLPRHYLSTIYYQVK
jgi:acyl carrier protein